MTSIALKKFTYKSICLEKDWASVHFRKKLINLTKCPTLKIANSRVTEVSTKGLHLDAIHFFIFEYLLFYLTLIWSVDAILFKSLPEMKYDFMKFASCKIYHFKLSELFRLIFRPIFPVLESSHWLNFWYDIKVHSIEYVASDSVNITKMWCGLYENGFYWIALVLTIRQCE